jgi:hypothetical protein
MITQLAKPTGLAPNVRRHSLSSPWMFAATRPHETAPVLVNAFAQSALELTRALARNSSADARTTEVHRD